MATKKITRKTSLESSVERIEQKIDSLSDDLRGTGEKPGIYEKVRKLEEWQEQMAATRSLWLNPLINSLIILGVGFVMQLLAFYFSTKPIIDRMVLEAGK